MADIKFGTSDPIKFYFGSDEVDKLYFGTTEIYTSTVQTTAPSISLFKSSPTYIIHVTNNDALTAEILADTTTPPTTDRGDIASGSYASINTGSSIGGFTMYATAQASGKSKSDIVSKYFS